MVAEPEGARGIGDDAQSRVSVPGFAPRAPFPTKPSTRQGPGSLEPAIFQLLPSV